MKLINATKIKDEVIQDMKDIVSTLNRKPVLAIVQVEGDKASNSYIKNKIKLGEDVGITVIHKLLPNNVTQRELNNSILSLDCANYVDGIILQLPLPKHLDFNEAVNFISKEKDVDGLTPIQQGLLVSGDKSALIPCTAKGIMKILKTEIDDLTGKNIVIINRSHLIGKPLMHLLLNENCTVQVCHSKTKDLKWKMREADIIITGIGKAHYFDKFYFKDGQTIIDCSMNFKDGKLVGDVNLEAIEHLDVTISSGKGQTGPLTVSSLIYNTIQAYMMLNNY